MRTVTIKNAALAAVFEAFCAVCAQLMLPFAIPFTMQSFAIFVTLGLLGGKLGTISVLLYLLTGALGFPVFSGFGGGIGRLLGATGGYIVGFVAICIAVLVAEKLSSRLSVLVAALGTGMLLCYIFGTLWYIFVYTKTGLGGFAAAFATCVLPFILPDAAKLFAAALIIKRLRPVFRKLQK